MNSGGGGYNTDYVANEHGYKITFDAKTSRYNREMKKPMKQSTWFERVTKDADHD